MHEASLYDVNSFITLTYDEEHHEPSLNYAHFQTFMRELRRTQKARFFAAGEYGEHTKRPHWHAILFGVGFEERYPVGRDLYGSKQLDALWPYGFASLGEVNQKTAAYVASYCVKKATGPLATERYSRVNLTTGEIFQVVPEMARMSLKPGIGAQWYEKYQREVHFARDGIVMPGGQKRKTPRYYDKLLQTNNIKQYGEIETERQLNSKHYSQQQLITQEINALAKQSMKRKKL